eukprot:scpid17602/ scgid35059/ 
MMYSGSRDGEMRWVCGMHYGSATTLQQHSHYQPNCRHQLCRSALSLHHNSSTVAVELLHPSTQHSFRSFSLKTPSLFHDRVHIIPLYTHTHCTSNSIGNQRYRLYVQCCNPTEHSFSPLSSYWCSNRNHIIVQN